MKRRGSIFSTLQVLPLAAIYVLTELKGRLWRREERGEDSSQKKILPTMTLTGLATGTRYLDSHPKEEEEAQLIDVC